MPSGASKVETLARVYFRDVFDVAIDVKPERGCLICDETWSLFPKLSFVSIL